MTNTVRVNKLVVHAAKVSRSRVQTMAMLAPVSNEELHGFLAENGITLAVSPSAFRAEALACVAEDFLFQHQV